MGFRRAVVPVNSPDDTSGMSVLRVATLDQALAVTGLHPAHAGR